MATESLKDKIYRELLEDILACKYYPKEILNEKDLVERFRCSKTPVREALISLCNDHVLRCLPRYGYEIIRLSIDDLSNMLQFRYVIECSFLSANYAAFTPAQIRRLEAIDEQCSKAEKDIWQHWEHNTRFHLEMLSFSNNAYALDELEKCMKQLRRAYAQFYWGTSERKLSLDTKNHQKIIQALSDKNLEDLLIGLKEDMEDFGGLNLHQRHIKLFDPLL